MMSYSVDLEFETGLLERGPGKEKRGWSLSAAKDLVGVLKRDRWVEGRVTKKREVTMS